MCLQPRFFWIGDLHAGHNLMPSSFRLDLERSAVSSLYWAHDLPGCLSRCFSQKSSPQASQCTSPYPPFQGKFRSPFATNLPAQCVPRPPRRTGFQHCGQPTNSFPGGGQVGVARHHPRRFLYFSSRRRWRLASISSPATRWAFSSSASSFLTRTSSTCCSQAGQVIWNAVATFTSSILSFRYLTRHFLQYR